MSLMGSATEFAGSGDKSFRFPNAQGQCEVKHKKINCYSNNRAKLLVRTFDAGFCPIQRGSLVPVFADEVFRISQSFLDHRRYSMPGQAGRTVCWNMWTGEVKNVRPGRMTLWPPYPNTIHTINGGPQPIQITSRWYRGNDSIFLILVKGNP